MKRVLLVLFSLLIAGALALSACQPAPVEEPAKPEVVVEEVEVEVTRIVAGTPITEIMVVTATPEPTEPPAEGPQVGGTYVITTGENPDTLDIQKSGFAIVSDVLSWLGGSLVTLDLEGNYIPWLAKSWEVSEDGLTYTFKLREDVKFHNGDPLTAHDWVWTFERALSEDFISPVSGDNLQPFTRIEALDDYTLVMGMDEPYYPILNTLSSSSYLAPYSQRAVEEGGQGYGYTSAVSVGPYKLESWVLDQHIKLVRNPDYNWGPELWEGINTGPQYIERVEYRVIPDYSTQLAAFLAGEITAFSVQPKDLAEFENNPKYNIYDYLVSGYYFITWNEEVYPFDDPLVRQAFSHAVDKQVLCDVASNGRCVPVYGPLSPAQIGYCDVEAEGLEYDVEKAKSLLAEAGYKDTDGNGIVEKDGKPLAFVFTSLTADVYAKYSQILIEMWKEIGADVTIEQYDWPTASPLLATGNFVMGTLHIGWPEADLMYMMFHSDNIGGLNHARLNNPELDALLEKTRTEMDPAAREEAVCEAMRWVQQDAPIIPLYDREAFYVVNSNVVGGRFSVFTGLALQDAYFVDLP